MAENPYAQFVQQPQGAMTLGTPNPYKQQSQQQDLTKGELDIRAKELDIKKSEVDLRKAELGQKDKALGVEQSKASGFYSRALKANDIYGNLGVGAPSVSREAAQAVLPSTVVNKLTDTDRQQAEAAQRDFIAATLRYESGAAIPPEELENQRATYFPVAGDSAETIALKARLRQNAIEALKMGAGAGANNVKADPQNDEQVRAEIERRIKAGADPAETIQWLVGIGRTPDKKTIDAIIANYGNQRPDVRPPEGADDPSAFGVGVGGVLQGAGDIANLVSSPFIQGVNAVTGSNINPDMGEALRNIFGTPDPQNNAERLAFETNRFGTGALGAAGLARQGARFIGGTVGPALERFGNMPVVDSIVGGVSGASGEAARQLGAGPVGQTLATLGGGILAAPVAVAAGSSRAINALMGGPDMPAPPIVRAGQQENVTVNRAMVDPNLQQRTTAVGKTMVGGRKMQSDMREIGGQIEGRVQALGQGGDVLEPQVAGQTVERAAERYIKTSGQKLGRIYDNLEKQVGDVKVPPTNALAKVDESIARLSELGNTNSAELKFLQGLKEDLAKDLSVASLRRLRSSLRQKIARGDLTFGEDEARVLSIMDAASDDIASGLTQSGKAGAAAAFKRVDTQYRERMEFIQNTIQKVIGKRNSHHHPEKIIANLRGMASTKGDTAAMARMIREMNPEEQRDIAATFADALGKNSKGEFSTAFLVNHLQKLPRAARVAAFGEEGAKSLENLETLAREHNRVTGALGGSPTGVANDYRGYLLNLVLGGGAGAFTDIGTGAAVAAGATAVKVGRDALSARALMSPKITGWLRSAPKTTEPKAINAHWDRLKAIAVREPALAPDIQRLQEMILRAVNENAPQTGRLAASPDEGPEQQ